RWNWASLGAGASGAAGAKRSGGRIGRPRTRAVLLSKVRIVDGRAHYRRLAGKSSVLAMEQINGTVTQAAPGAPLRLQGNAVAQPGDVKLVIRDATLTPSSTRVLAEMAVRATVDI